MKKFQFSLPMPYTIEDINKIIDINNQVNKSQITSLYINLPSTCELSTSFEQNRNFMFNRKDFDYWENLMKHSLNKGIDLIYLLNNPSPIDSSSFDFNNQINKLDKLLYKLKEIGITKIRVASQQLSSFLKKYYADFNIYASTSLDYKTISEYQNFIMFHSEVKQIIPSHDINKNFILLKNLKHDYPDLDMEIMVNEGCMQGCPNRNIHEMIASESSERKIDVYFSPSRYCTEFCGNIMKKYPFYSLTLNNNIFPWDIEAYSKIGINKFKLVGRDLYTYNTDKYIQNYLLYLKAVDNAKEVEDVSIVTFIHHLLGNNILKQLKTKEVRHLLPKIEYFKKYGHLCASKCGVECRYCYKCAEKIEKVFKKKQEEMRKMTRPVCVINKANVST